MLGTKKRNSKQELRKKRKINVRKLKTDSERDSGKPEREWENGKALTLCWDERICASLFVVGLTVPDWWIGSVLKLAPIRFANDSGNRKEAIIAVTLLQKEQKKYNERCSTIKQRQNQKKLTLSVFWCLSDSEHHPCHPYWPFSSLTLSQSCHKSCPTW